MKPEWADQREDPHTIDLSDEDLDVVRYYVQWLYSDKIEDSLDPTYVGLAKAYIFGDKRLDVSFRNAILNNYVALSMKHETYPGPEALGIIYAGTRPGSSLRRLLVSQYVYEVHDADEWQQEIPLYPQEFMAEVLQAIIKGKWLPKEKWTNSIDGFLE